ncbi:hypothetical protein KFL_000480030 [Klebsormidium nitens]|uniref:Uncharacterized protein n=1 Tax=Klebsormidium nitens TaxID=105231 RepID=A0A1Y1HQU2_KLENI|nr:hypothetical protein KFL_000480030 [Klebsormidium nitens]|eukprot:GAQ80162.1 hypothetical protein KFL_000480030 [Klebsormidium nitens]
MCGPCSPSSSTAPSLAQQGGHEVRHPFVAAPHATGLDDALRVACGSLTGQLATNALVDGQYRATFRSVKNESGISAAVKNVKFWVGIVCLHVSLVLAYRRGEVAQKVVKRATP